MLPLPPRVTRTFERSALLAAILALLPAVPAAAAPRARPTAPLLLQRSTFAGSTIAVRMPGGTMPSYFLSMTSRRSRTSVGLPGAREKGHLVLHVPAHVPAGSYHLLACRGRVCAVAAGRLSVTPSLTHLKPPLTVHPVLTGVARSQPMTAVAGGKLTARGTDGTTYTLEVPANALPTDMSVSLQPVGRLAGLPGVVVEGVRIEPEGVQLAGAAKLVVSRGPKVRRGALITGFLAPDDGRGLALAPALSQHGAFTVPLTHFSYHGLIGASSVRLDAVAAHQAQTAADQIASETAGELARGDTAGAQDTFARSEAPFYSEVVKPLLEDALDRDSASSALAAVTQALGYVREAQLLGVGGVSLERLGINREMLRYLLSVAYVSAYKKCAENHDLKNGPAALLGVVREAQLIGEGDLFSGVYDDINRCFHFRLDFDSEVRETQSDGSSDFHVVAPVDVRGTYDYSAFRFVFSGSGPLTYVTATGHHHSTQDSCGGIEDTSDVTGATGSTMTLTAMNFDPFHAAAGSPGITVSVDPGDPQETYHEYGTQCPDGSAFDDTSQSSGWLLEWGSILHAPQSQSGGAPWTFSDFTPGAGAVIGTRTFDQEQDIQLGSSDQTGHLSEHTTITLTHTPDPPPALPSRPMIPAQKG